MWYFPFISKGTEGAVLLFQVDCFVFRDGLVLYVVFSRVGCLFLELCGDTAI